MYRRTRMTRKKSTSVSLTQGAETGKFVMTTLRSVSPYHRTVETPTRSPHRTLVRAPYSNRTPHRYGGGSSASRDDDLYRRPRPSDVSHAFRFEQKYSGDSYETLRRKFNLFMRAVHVANLDPSSKDTMLDVFSTYFLTGTARVYYMDFVEHQA